MKKQFLSVCFVLLETISYAQNYQLILPTNEQHFLYAHTTGSPNYHQEIRSIRIDTSVTQGAETYYYNHKILEETPTSSLCLADHNDSSWVGHQIIASNNGDYVFFNKQLDSIVIKSLAPLNDTWTIYKFGNGDYIEGTLVSIDTATILNHLDSIKTIHLQVKDAANNIIVHPMNTKVLQFSKQNGWVQFFDFHTFPNDTIPYQLVGSSAQPNIGINNPTHIDFFNFNVGDEIHTTGEYRPQATPWIFGKHKTIRTVLSKTVSTNQDTITYTYEDCIARIDNDAMQGKQDTTFLTDTVVQRVIVSTDVNNLGQLTHELAPDSSGFSVTSVRNFASLRKQKVTFNYFYYDTFNSCWTFYFDVWPQIWIEGIGGPFVNSPARKNMPVYYKKGNETWGIPVNCSTFLNIPTIANEEQTIQIFPNPLTETATLQIKNFDAMDNWSLRLLDVTGKVVRSTPIQKATHLLHKGTLPSGVYFYQLTNTQQQKQYTGKLILQDN